MAAGVAQHVISPVASHRILKVPCQPLILDMYSSTGRPQWCVGESSLASSCLSLLQSCSDYQPEVISRTGSA